MYYTKTVAWSRKNLRFSHFNSRGERAAIRNKGLTKAETTKKNKQKRHSFECPFLVPGTGIESAGGVFFDFRISKVIDLQ